MGISLSILPSAWKEILKHKFFGLMGARERVIVRSISLRAISFKKNDSETMTRLDDTDQMIFEESISFKNCKPDEIKIDRTVSFINSVLDREDTESVTSKGKTNDVVHKSKPTISLPKPVIPFSPKPPKSISERDAAAIKLQKVYKSYRTRRNLADCAVVIEELWWKALDFAALKRSSVSFFDIEKPESVVSRWARARTRAAKVGKGLSKDEKAQKLALQHWLEAIDPRHRYGHNLHYYYDLWFDSESTQPFFYWLDVGDGKEVNIGRCPRSNLQLQCIKYLGPKEREVYEVVVDGGKLVYRQSGMLVDTEEGSKWIFVLSTMRALYIGQKKKGVFQHSSFLSGGATTAAGRLVAHNGILEAIWPYSGHYHPTEENFREFISFLEENHVDLNNVKRCAIDDESPSFKVGDEEPKPEQVEEPTTSADSAQLNTTDAEESANDTTMMKDHEEDDMDKNAADVAKVFDMGKLLSCKWTTGTGPRIGCVRDYPSDLQARALEQVNLSPRVTPGSYRNHVPIPSPRPSPKIRLSPRFAYMGLPSPSASVPAVN